MAESDSEVSFESADEGGEDIGTKSTDEGAERAEGVPSSNMTTECKVSTKSIEEETMTSSTDISVEQLRTMSDENARVGDKQKTDKVESHEDAKEVSGNQEPTATDSDVNPVTVDVGDVAEVFGESAKAVGDDQGQRMDGEEGERKPEAPEGEEIQNRGACEGTKSDARAGGSPQHAAAASGSGGWGWGGWGSSLLSSAAATVTKVSDNVGKGLTSVLENVESSLGVPKPEELREIEKKEAAKVAGENSGSQQQQTGDQAHTAMCSEDDKPQSVGNGGQMGVTEERAESGGAEGAGIGGFFSYGASALTNVMEKTVIGGLDALELIGRKTMDILQDGDPRLEKKRAFVAPKQEKITLSEVLRLAKEEAEAEAERRQEEEELQKYNFGMLFDQYQGLAHLEALEILSIQSETKVQSAITVVTEDALEEVKTELLEIRDAFCLEDLEPMDEEDANNQDFVNVVTELLFSLSVAATPDKLQRVQKGCRDWLSKHKDGQGEEGAEDGEERIKEVHANAMQTLAELTARTIEQFHKVAELMLLDQDKAQTKSPVERSTALSKLTSILSAEVSSVATRFCELLSTMANQSPEAEEINTIITNIYLEASNSTSYIQDAFQLLLPVLQDIAVARRNVDQTP